MSATTEVLQQFSIPENGSFSPWITTPDLTEVVPAYAKSCGNGDAILRSDKPELINLSVERESYGDMRKNSPLAAEKCDNHYFRLTGTHFSPLQTARIRVRKIKGSESFLKCKNDLVVYEIFDPRTFEIVYIGEGTHFRPYQSHSENVGLRAWIAERINEGYESPNFVRIVERGIKSKKISAEKEGLLIRRYESQGATLFNIKGAHGLGNESTKYLACLDPSSTQMEKSPLRKLLDRL